MLMFTTSGNILSILSSLSLLVRSSPLDIDLKSGGPFRMVTSILLLLRFIRERGLLLLIWKKVKICVKLVEQNCVTNLLCKTYCEAINGELFLSSSKLTLICKLALLFCLSLISSFLTLSLVSWIPFLIILAALLSFPSFPSFSLSFSLSMSFFRPPKGALCFVESLEDFDLLVAGASPSCSSLMLPNWSDGCGWFELLGSSFWIGMSSGKSFQRMEQKRLVS